MTKDQAEVTKDQSQLRTQAISDYTSSGTTNQVTQMFSSDPNTTGIRTEYSSIATGNVTTTIDNLHTAQAQLQATQAALQQQQSSATATRDNLQTAKDQAGQLASQYQGTLNSVDAQIQTIVAQQQAAAAAAAAQAAQAAFNAKVAAAQKIQATGGADRVPDQPLGGSAATAVTAVPAGPRPRLPPAWPGPSRPPRARSVSPTCGAANPPVRVRLLRPGAVVLCAGRHLPPPHLGGPVRRHHPHPARRYPAR